ncbi:MAG TPA: LacI family DNA-binding transcriptional regulator [Streptosporangiaceae bacterium]|nr:LacI family DNA-binding transcriptional regulator [Streptosporangiaceae bacterium]
MPTIVDVARMANVSTSTVSHVVNGTRPVSDRTRARVEQAIAVTGYSQHGLARALRRNRSDSVGLVVSDTSQHVFGQIVAGVESEARQAGLTLLLANSAEDPAYERESVRTLLDRRVDGLLLAQVAASDASVLAACRAADCPVVLIDRLTNPAFDQVGVENTVAMQALTRHLIEVGHRDPVLLAGDLGVSTIRDRVRGFEAAMAEAGLRVTEESIVWTGRGLTDGHDQVGDLLDRRRPGAIIAASGLMTIGALRAFQQRQLVIPDDLAFASFDSISNARFMTPRLTSVVQPAAEIGREAMGLLLRRLANPAADPKTILMQPRIWHGTSCGCDGSAPLPLT